MVTLAWSDEISNWDDLRDGDQMMDGADIIWEWRDEKSRWVQVGPYVEHDNANEDD